MKLEWSERLETGHGLVDHQHRALLDAINDFDDALQAGVAPARIDEMLAFLERYAREHFHMEEFLMLRSYFPGMELHKDQHDRLVQRVTYIRDLRAQDPRLVPPEGLAAFLGDWLLNHILQWDMALFAHLREHPLD